MTKRSSVLFESLLGFLIFVAAGVGISYLIKGDLNIYDYFGPMFCGFLFTVFLNVARVLFVRNKELPQNIEAEEDEVSL